MNYYRKLETFNHLLSNNYPYLLLKNAFEKSFNYNAKKPKKENVFPIIFSYNKSNIELLKSMQPYIDILKSNSSSCDLFSKFNILKSFSLHKNILSHFLIPSKFSVKKCNKTRCLTCPMLIEYYNTINIKGINFNINNNLNCCSKNVIYILICSCNLLYIGKTNTPFNIRNNTHRQQSNNEKYIILPFNKHIYDTKHSYKCTFLYYVSDEIQKFILEIEHFFQKLLL